MKTSDKGIALIKKYEGFSPTPYRCPAGKNTVAFGHLVRKGEMFHTVTEAEGERLLRADLRDAEEAVNRLVTVNLTQNEFDSLVSFAFNLGAEQLRTSTLLKLLNKGDYGGASDQFSRWTYAGGKSLDGLKKRRAAEKELFLTP